MPRIEPIDQNSAQVETRELLERVQSKYGMVPNLLATMAHSTALTNGYLSFSQSLSEGLLPPQLREQIALTVGEANQCEYCLAAHSAVGNLVGLTEQQVLDARAGGSADPRTAAALRFAQQLVEKRGNVSHDDLARLRNADFGEAEIAEIVGLVALNIFTNYFNHVAETEVDFPRVAALTV